MMADIPEAIRLAIREDLAASSTMTMGGLGAFSPGPSQIPCDGFSCRLLVGAGCVQVLGHLRRDWPGSALAAGQHDAAQLAGLRRLLRKYAIAVSVSEIPLRTNYRREVV